MATIERILLIPVEKPGEFHKVDAFADALVYKLRQATKHYQISAENHLARAIREDKGLFARFQARAEYSIPPFMRVPNRSPTDLDVFLTPMSGGLREACEAFGTRTSTAFVVFETGALDVDETAMSILGTAETINQTLTSDLENDTQQSLDVTSLELRPITEFGDGDVLRLLRDTEALLGVADRMLDDTQIPKADRNAAESDVLAFHSAFDRPGGPLPAVLTGYITSIASFVTHFSGVVEALRSTGGAEARAGADLIEAFASAAANPDEMMPEVFRAAVEVDQTILVNTNPTEDTIERVWARDALSAATRAAPVGIFITAVGAAVGAPITGAVVALLSTIFVSLGTLYFVDR